MPGGCRPTAEAKDVKDQFADRFLNEFTNRKRQFSGAFVYLFEDALFAKAKPHARTVIRLT